MNLIDRISSAFADQLNLDEWIVYFTGSVPLWQYGSVAGRENSSGNGAVLQLFKQCIMSLSGCTVTMLYCRGRSDIYPLDNKAVFLL